MAPGSVQLNIFQWNAKLARCAQAGHYEKTMEPFEQTEQEGMSRALELSQQMHHEGVEADPGTFVGVLNACASVGALGRGRRVREQIIQCGFESDIFVDALYHYACIVDLLRRAGLLLEAEDLITMMPCVQDAAVWKTLLGACRHHGDAEMGEQIARKVLELDPGSATGYVLLTNIYAGGGKWDLSVKV
ncbi:unnamed protein product [Sphagnum troendelagicum]